MSKKNKKLDDEDMPHPWVIAESLSHEALSMELNSELRHGFTLVNHIGENAYFDLEYDGEFDGGTYRVTVERIV